MKKTMLSLCCLISAPTQASIYQFGPRIGVISSKISYLSPIPQLSDVSLATGYQAGVMAQVNLPIIYLQPELLLTGAGSQYTYRGQKRKLAYTKLDLPILVGTKFLGLLKIEVGPNLSLLLSAKEDTKDIKVDYKLLSLGYQIGLGLDIWRIMADLKYEGNLTQFGHKLAGIPIDHGLSLWVLSLCFNIS